MLMLICLGCRVYRCSIACFCTLRQTAYFLEFFNDLMAARLASQAQLVRVRGNFAHTPNLVQGYKIHVAARINLSWPMTDSDS